MNPPGKRRLRALIRSEIAQRDARTRVLSAVAIVLAAVSLIDDVKLAPWAHDSLLIVADWTVDTADQFMTSVKPKNVTSPLQSEKRGLDHARR